MRTRNPSALYDERGASSFIDVFMALVVAIWLIGEVMAGHNRQLEIFARTGVLVSWEIAQGCKSERLGVMTKWNRGCYSPLVWWDYEPVTDHPQGPGRGQSAPF